MQAVNVSLCAHGTMHNNKNHCQISFIRFLTRVHCDISYPYMYIINTYIHARILEHILSNILDDETSRDLSNLGFSLSTVKYKFKYECSAINCNKREYSVTNIP